MPVIALEGGVDGIHLESADSDRLLQALCQIWRHGVNWPTSDLTFADLPHENAGDCRPPDLPPAKNAPLTGMIERRPIHEDDLLLRRLWRHCHRLLHLQNWGFGHDRRFYRRRLVRYRNSVPLSWLRDPCLLFSNLL